MKKLLVISFLLCYAFCFNGQNANASDTLNKYNEANKKHGYWKEYLNDKLKSTKNEKKAIFYRLRYYDNGKKVGPDYSNQTSSKVKLKVIKGVQPNRNTATIIDGLYQLSLKKAKYVYEYEKGIMKDYKMFAFGNNKYVLMEHYNYRKRYNNQKGTAYIELFWGTGQKRLQAYYRKKNGIWGSNPIQDKD